MAELISDIGIVTVKLRINSYAKTMMFSDLEKK